MKVQKVDDVSKAQAVYVIANGAAENQRKRENLPSVVVVHRPQHGGDNNHRDGGHRQEKNPAERFRDFTKYSKRRAGVSDKRGIKKIPKHRNQFGEYEITRK